MRICWITSSEIKSENGTLGSEGADARYRVLMPVKALNARGHAGAIRRLSPDPGPAQLADEIEEELVVLGKLVPATAAQFGPMGNYALQLIPQLQARGKKVIVDINDYHFENGERGAYFRDIVKLADAVSASTPVMAAAIGEYTDRPVVTARDPFEGPRGQAKPVARSQRRWRRRLGLGAQAQARVRMLWFGYPVNLDSLPAMVEQLAPVSRKQPISLQVVTMPGFGAAEYCAELNSRPRHDIRAEFLPWSRDRVWNLMAECDVVAIPSLQDQLTKAVKSPNRIVEAIRAGRFVIAHPLPAYREFERFAWIGEDLGQGLRWALNHPEEVVERIAQGQSHIAANFSPEIAASEWEAIFRRLAQGELAANAHAVGESRKLPLRLNLGCGDKILAGHVNVDIAPSRNAAQPDVICDLHHLAPFETGSVDEILSVHVIEHFWRWEVKDLLLEWMRVLRPGGKLIIECPNLEAACEAFLADPDLASGPGREGESTMWVFYGDPAWRDPLMCHRWGYTPTSLARLLEGVGLSEVRQEKAQFKMREPRDMRVVAIKPR
ncbi:MAG TPA: methyltransferase domain-containing protein [Burkholderiales bacterium]|nr:methyltransferase domain-containing protein [Burkholderiales bacterium]